jgi:SAM-dependent methyltransferase
MPTTIRNAGSGPGARTIDGCSVEFWKQLKPGAEPEIIASAVPGGASILELGAGVGRITHPLLAFGYRVTAVDNSADMLAEIRGAETHLGDIEDLALGRRFDAVLLCSCLIHAPGVETRRALLDTCRRHLAAGGMVLIQRYPENWPGEEIKPGFNHTRDGEQVHMTVGYETALCRWTHSFTVEPLDRAKLDTALAASGLRFDRFLDPRETWAVARAI